MRRRSSPSIAVAIVVAVLCAAPLAHAGVTLVAPVRGASVPTGKPTFQWSLPPGEVATTLQVSSSSTRDANGHLDGTDFDLASVLGSTYRPAIATGALEAGRWFWDVLSVVDETGADEESGIGSFTVPLRIDGRRLRCSAIVDGLTATLQLLANVDEVRAVTKVKRGGRTIVTQRDTIFPDRFDRRERQTINVRFSGEAHTGDRLKVVIRLSSGRRTQTLARQVVVRS